MSILGGLKRIGGALMPPPQYARTPPFNPYDGDYGDEVSGYGADTAMSPPPPPKRAASPQVDQNGIPAYDPTTEVSSAPIPPQKLSARDQYAAMPPPPIPGDYRGGEYKPSSIKRQLIGGLLRLAPGVNMTDIPEEIAAPGYRQKALQYGAESEAAKRRAALEDQAEQRAMTQEARDIAKRNAARMEESAKRSDENQDLDRRLKIDEEYKSRGGKQVASSGFDLTPGTEGDYETETDPLGRTWQVPTAARQARVKKEAEQVNWLSQKDIDDALQAVGAAKPKQFRTPQEAAMYTEKRYPKEFADKLLDLSKEKTPTEVGLAWQASGHDPEKTMEILRKNRVTTAISISQGRAAATGSGTGVGAGDHAYNISDEENKHIRDLAAKNPALDKDAWDYLITGRINTRGRNPQEQVRILKARGGQLMSDFAIDPGELMARGVDLKGASAAFSKISTYAAQIEAFEDTLLRNSELAKKLSDAYQRNDIQFLNRLENAWKTGVGDSEAVNLAAQLHGVSREWAKIMQGSVSAMGVPINEARETDALISKAMSNKQLYSLIDNVIVKDAQNRKAANDAEKERLLSRIRGVASGGGGPAAANGARPAASGAVPTINTQAEWDKLPSGAQYIDAQTGKRATKR